MPFPNEHSCRLEDPDQFEEFRRENGFREDDGRRIDGIFGIDGDESTLQALRYPAGEWGEDEAREHCTAEDGIEFEAATGEQEDSAASTNGRAVEEGEVVRRSMDVAIREQDGNPGTFTFEISNEQLDRHGTIIDPEGLDFENFKSNPVVLWDHGLDPQRGSVPIGRSPNIQKRGDKILADVQFAGDGFAQDLREKVEEKIINGASVGIKVKTLERDMDGDEPPVITESELMEFSLVAVPSNPSALAQRAQMQELMERFHSLERTLIGREMDADPPSEEAEEDAIREDAESSADPGDGEAIQETTYRLTKAQVRDLIREAKAARRQKARRIAKRELGIA